MMKHLIVILALSAVSCDKGTPPRAKATVTLTSVSFADDCGGTPPSDAPPSPARREAPAAAAKERAEPLDEGARRRCEQTSMQLVVVGDAGTELHIKSVEVFDADGKSLGKLSASKPTRWNETNAAYEPWDEKVGAASSAVSYVLSQPSFVDQWDARDRTYTVKVIASVAGVDQPLKTTVLVVGRPPPVPT
ncbi:MAG TPA: hypothetical protein VMZ53_22385 [Kofleriaceae bacterium]|nr:hypothetical protein [Kofleriaceae bacterium]